MYRLVVASVPSDQAKDVIQDIVTGNYMGAVISFLKASGQIIEIGHVTAANYRSEREIFAAFIPPLARSLADIGVNGCAITQPYDKGDAQTLPRHSIGYSVLRRARASTQAWTFR